LTKFIIKKEKNKITYSIIFLGLNSVWHPPVATPPPDSSLKERHNTSKNAIAMQRNKQIASQGSQYRYDPKNRSWTVSMKFTKTEISVKIQFKIQFSNFRWAKTDFTDKPTPINQSMSLVYQYRNAKPGHGCLASKSLKIKGFLDTLLQLLTIHIFDIRIRTWAKKRMTALHDIKNRRHIKIEKHFIVLHIHWT
jgi:hypothetical protein